ncbi:methionyl-tRNA formyltransferase [Acinetobacter qingfengensis]|uniref:Methionyl-tRNA formyltransferase n=1 Tax=Acinetobacter qingfengensis TaxID=1262585 RepID=A0A1E7QWD6_9GAMM|nr:methionyl-tRNA formyltransferase [Acinetobacter qingfengensis]KAA8731327.1 methionyl-tRNA formyltransferase [Acinetobacter qingfengensis]OEY91427.1 methionyl-tRNA formyltransferase [Acinetobacter qingfengensis]
MKIIFAGTPDFAASALNRLLQTEHEIVAVYTQPDRKAGRGQKLTASPVKALALQHDLVVMQPLHFKNSTEEGLTAQQELAAFNADVMVVAAYGLLLPQAVLDTPKYGCLNIHASLLPRWRGAAPIQRAIQSGDAQTGITIMQMAKGLDTGDMLYKVNCDILASDNAATVHDKLAKIGAEAIAEVLISEQTLQQYQAQRQIQDENLSSYAHKISKTEARIDWAQPAKIIDLHIRAFNPVPVAFTQLDEHTALRVWSAQSSTQSHTVQYGEILNIDKNGVVVACGAGTTICLTELQWPGGKPLNQVQILQTQKLQVGQILL